MSRATPEGRVKNAVKKLLETYRHGGLWYYMPVQGGFGQQGIPDFIISFRGRMMVIECKAPSGILTDLQRLQLTLIQNSGALALVQQGEDVQALEAHLNMISTL